MVENSISNLRSKTAPVSHFTHLSGKVFLPMEIAFQVPSALGRLFSLSMSGLLSEIWKSPFVASWIVLSKSGTVKNYLFCSILSDTLVETWDTYFRKGGGRYFAIFR